MTVTQERTDLSDVEIDDAPAWRVHSRCIGEDPEIFFKGGGSTFKAKKICGACPVRQQGLELGLEHDECSGIRGGLTCVGGRAQGTEEPSLRLERAHESAAQQDRALVR
ncbi:WhiB family transcriptional regulator [Streptomyces chartreusis]|uniref:WhiB family transcriptional regulator n=1 Tax=Streptomyces chartreusis TaxID=1969 RepID=UPI00369907A3